MGVKCEVRGVPTTSEESEIFVGIYCGVQGVINTSAESDKNSVRENTGMNKDECAECVICSRTRRLVSGTGHWGLQLGGRGAQCVSEKVLELRIEDVREGFRDEVTNSRLQKRKKSLLKKKIGEMRNRVDLENIEENLKTQGVQESIVTSGDMCEKSAKVTSGDDDGHSAPQPSGAQCVYETVTNHHQHPPQASHKVQGAHKIVHTDNHQPHLHRPPPKYTKKSAENLLCDQSNKEWPLRPDLGALRYQGVQSPWGTTLCNTGPQGLGLNKPSKVSTENTTPNSTINHHPQPPPPAPPPRQLHQLDKINIEHKKKAVKRWKEMKVENGKFSIQDSTDFGVVKSTNAKKELKYRLARKEKEKKMKNSKDLRQELQILSEKKKEKFIELFSKQAKKRKKPEDENEVEVDDKTKVQKLTTLEDKNCYNTPKTNVSEKPKSIPGGKISKLRNIFERKEDISKKGGVSSMKPSLAKK